MANRAWGDTHKTVRSEDFQDGVLYTLWGGNFVKFHGTVRILKWLRDDEVTHVAADFTEDHPPHKREPKRFGVYHEPGILSNRIIWFPKENDKRAIQIFIQNEQDMIADLNKKIKVRQDTLSALNELLETMER